MDNKIEEFIKHLYTNKLLSKNSIDAYKRDIIKFEMFLKGRSEKIELADGITIMAFSQNLQNSKMSVSSIIRNIITVRKFYRYLVKKGLMTEDPTVDYQLPKIKKNVPQVLSVEEVDKLLSSPDLSINKGIRDKAMLEVMYAAGLKITELLNITIFDINLKLGFLICRGEKNKERVIPLGTVAIKCIQDYLNIRSQLNINNLDILFLNLMGKKMSRQGFWKIIKYYSKESGIGKNIDANTLRHSFAVHLIQNGADIKSVQELLGHTELSSTQIYSFVSKKTKITEIYKKCHPRA